jgi:hypothetical protein
MTPGKAAAGLYVILVDLCRRGLGSMGPGGVRRAVLPKTAENRSRRPFAKSGGLGLRLFGERVILTDQRRLMTALSFLYSIMFKFLLNLPNPSGNQ